MRAQRRARGLRRAAAAALVVLGAHLGVLLLAQADVARDLAEAEYPSSEETIELRRMPDPPTAKPPRRPSLSRPRAGSKPAPPRVEVLAVPEPVAAPTTVAPVTPPLAPNGQPAYAPGDLVTVDDLPDVSAPPGADSQYPINPGEWDVVERWLVLSRTEKYCIAPDNILRFMVAPCNHIYHCAYSVEDVADGKLHFVGVIRGKDQVYNVRGSGAYTQTHLKVSVTGTGHWRFLPVAFGASLDGRFVSAQCSPAAKTIRQR